jgi:outer membrane protein assembly factor BamD (BamD/ComL family)
MTEFPTMIASTFPRVALLAAVLAAALATSCATAPVVIPPDLDAKALVQRAQEASDASKYELAVRYYQALIDNYGLDPANLVTGEYEIAFIAYKQGKTEKAKELFTALLARYDGPGAAALPPLYKVLAQKVMAELK